MGAYVYALQPPETMFEAQLNGIRVKVGRLKFAYKPYQTGNAAELNSKADREIIGPLREAWRNRGRPRFVLIGDTCENEPFVYSWPPGWVSCVDDINFGVKVKQVGRLRGGVIDTEAK